MTNFSFMKWTDWIKNINQAEVNLYIKYYFSENVEWYEKMGKVEILLIIMLLSIEWLMDNYNNSYYFFF